jgi:hypothetical protein
MWASALPCQHAQREFLALLHAFGASNPLAE